MPRNKHPEETVQKILDAALSLFMEKGYEKTTILDIVKRMDGLTRGAFYHHFKSKEAVLDALGYKLFHENNPFEKVRKRSDLNGLEKLRFVICDNLQDVATQTVNEASVPLFDDPKFLCEFFMDNKTIVYPCLEELIQEGMEDGSLRKGNAKLSAEFIMLLANIWFLPQLFNSTEAQDFEKLSMIKRILDLEGLPIFDDEVIQIATSEHERFTGK